MKTACTNLLLLTRSAFWSSSRWPLATWMSSRRQRSIPLGGRYRQVSLYYIIFSILITDFHSDKVLCLINRILCPLSHRTYASLTWFIWAKFQFPVKCRSFLRAISDGGNCLKQWSDYEKQNTRSTVSWVCGLTWLFPSGSGWMSGHLLR